MKIRLLKCFLAVVFVQLSCSSLRETPKDFVVPQSYSYHIQGSNFSLMNVDQVGNMYLVKNQRTLLKYNIDGNLDKTFDSQLAGFIYSIDVANPLYLLVFYRDAGKIMLFDRNLAPLKEISLATWTKNDITAVSLSNNNQLWMYDTVERKLLRYSIEGDRVLESADLYGVTNLELSIETIREYNNQVYLRNREGKLLVLDNLGRFIEDLDITTGLPLRGVDEVICFPKGDEYGCLSKSAFEYTYEKELEVLGIEECRVLTFGGMLFVETEGGVLTKNFNK